MGKVSTTRFFVARQKIVVEFFLFIFTTVKFFDNSKIDAPETFISKLVDTLKGV